MRKKAISIVLLAISAWLPLRASADNPNDILIIAHRSVSQKSVTEAELREIFLKKRNNWSSGGRAIPIQAPEDTTIRRVFRKRILGMTATEETQYWQDRKIKAGISKPAEFTQTLKAVYKLKGSVGYVYRSQYREGVVKVLMVLSATQ